ncbi:MAG TPA: hypothetical protein VHL09_01325, partial [Dehalococcoidia bacterium]|nr:hypothetical protein [Dehalococcoidia bacterium]
LCAGGPGSGFELARLAEPSAAPAFYLGAAASAELGPDFDRRFAATTGLSPWPEARQMYALAARLIERVDAAQREPGRFSWLSRPDRSVDWLAFSPGEPSAHRTEIGIYRLAPEGFPGLPLMGDSH